MKRIVAVAVLLLCYLILIPPLTDYMRNKPVVEKLGYIPQAEVLQFFSADQKQLLAASLVGKVLIYFGTIVEKSANKIEIPPDYKGMSRIIHTSVKLDPYNMDSYYFAQAILVWDVGQIKVANDLLEYGMRYRDWDFYLPFFAGFNYAFFLKDYEQAAKYYKRAGELTGEELHVNLAGRYMYESGRTDLAIAYLATMEKGAKNAAVKKSFGMRLEALKGVRLIERARDAYRKETGAFPESLQQLIERGYLARPPADPYGGKFFLNGAGQVRSTSGFAGGAAGKR